MMFIKLETMLCFIHVVITFKFYAYLWYNGMSCKSGFGVCYMCRMISIFNYFFLIVLDFTFCSNYDYYFYGVGL